MFAKLVPLCGAEPAPGLPTVRERLKAGEPTRIVCFGDSITGAYYHTGGKRAWCDMLGVALAQIHPQARLEMFNAGVSGHTTEAGLARIERDVLARQPHLVVVMFGMNDVARLPLKQFLENLGSIVAQCHKAGAAVVLCTPNSVYDNAGRPNPKLDEMAERVRAFCKERALPVVDCFSDWQQARRRYELDWMLLMSDEIHPNMNGHRRFAELVAEAITERPVSLAQTPPPADALHHTLTRLAAGEAVHLVAMPPYDQAVAAALRAQFPQAEIRVTTWPIEHQSLAEMRAWAQKIRELKPDLVVPAVPATAADENDQNFIDHYEWILNWSFPFAGRAWDVVPVLPGTSEPVAQEHMRRAALARRIVIGKDVRFIERPAGELRSLEQLLAAWTSEQRQTLATAWPTLPTQNAEVEIPAQPWPRRPGPRQVRLLVHYPGGKLASVNERTGIMLSLHNWGGENCVGTAAPQTLADHLNVVAVCVNYLQSGPKDSIEGPEAYDFGYLQALDALRAVWWVRVQLPSQKIAYADGRIFATGGSGGGNVTLMANKLAPRTFAGVIDLCGMKKLSADIAFGLPGGSDLNARYSRDPKSADHLTLDQQDLRFLGHAGHLKTMRMLGNSARIVTVHGVEDVTCPFADAQEMVAALKAAGLDVQPHFIRQAEVDGKVFTSAGHSLGNRTEIVLQVGAKPLAAEGEGALVRRTKTDFELADERVRYRTPSGEFVVSYAAGFPVGRFEPTSPPPDYDEHHDLTYYRDALGDRRAIQTADDWQVRRAHLLEHLQRVMGPLPGESYRVDLDVKVLEEKQDGELIRRKLSYQSDPFDRVTAWLLTPAAAADKKLSAMLCLHQTTRGGKDEPVGIGGKASLHYAKELALRGYVVLAPDYPTFGEHPYDFAQHPEYVSGTMKAIWDNVRAIDLLVSRPEVDAERIGVIGHSLGGHNALFTAMFEPRLKAIVSSCGFTSLVKDDVPSWTSPTYMPRIASQFQNDARQVPFDFPEIVAALAPRAFLACAATRDDDFDVSGVRDCLSAATPTYKLLGKPDALQGDYPDSPHDFPEATRSKAYEFLDRHLK